MVMWEKVPVPLQTNQNQVKMKNLAAIATEITSLQVNGGIEQNGSGNTSNLVINAFTALKVNEIAENGNVAKTGMFDSNQVMPVSGHTSVNTRLSEIPSGRFNVPKEIGSGTSSLSSACSDLSEDLPEFAAMPPTVPIVRPVPCHTSVTNSSNSISYNASVSNNSSLTSEVNLSGSDMVTVSAKDGCDSDKNAENNPTLVINGAGQASCASESLTLSSVTLCGQKSNIQPSSVFCAPKAGYKTASEKGTVTYPPFSVQKNIYPSDKKADILASNSNTVTTTEANNGSSKQNDKQNPVNNLQPFVVPMNIPDKESKKADKSRFIPGHKLVDKQRSLFTYMKRNRPNAPVNRKDAFMTLNMAEDKSKSQPNTPAPFLPINQLTADGNVSYLGKVQQYLMNNKVGFGDAKFDGMMLKSRSETAIDCMIIGRDRKSSIGDSASSCNSRVVSPMSEWFGRKVTSPTRSVYSTANVRGMKRKSLTETVEVVRQDKKARSEAVIVNGQGSGRIVHVNGHLNGRILIVNGQANGNHSVGHVVAPSTNVKENNATLMNNRVVSNNVPQAAVINGHNEPQKNGGNSGVPETSDCVLQDLYEALNIPYQDVGSTMANVMSDVDDILDFMKPSELTTGISGTVSAALPARPISGQLAFSNG